VRTLADEYDWAVIDGTFFNADEHPGRDLSKVPHPTVQHTLTLIPHGRGRVFFTHLNHTNALLCSPQLREQLRSNGFDVVAQRQVFQL
jgi:pyrroloquinoline quinone biosynthesis protein B